LITTVRKLKERKKESKKKGHKTRGWGIDRINFKLDNKLGPTVWAVLPADRIAQKIKLALYKYYTNADNEVAYFTLNV
jgi:hypothetical protein